MLGRWTTTSARTLLALLAATTLIPATALGAAADDHPPGVAGGATLTVTPSTGLVDHQLVVVEGDGFPTNRRVDLQQCPPRPFDDTCEPWLGHARTDADGHFSVQVSVSAFAEDFGRDDVDCRDETAGRCTIRTFTGTPTKARIRFDPDAPLAPPPVATVTPSDTAVDGQLVDVAVTGLRPGTQVSLQQCAVPDPRLDQPGCDPYAMDDVEGRFQAGPEGRYDARVRVRARIDLLGGGRADCRTSACTLLVADDRHTLAVAALSLQPGSALAPRITADATPRTGLQGREVVQVSGSGFFTDGLYGWTVLECTLPLPGVFPDVFGPGFACDDRAYEYGDVADDGTFSAEVTVRSVIRHGNRQLADCRRRSCGLVALRDNRGHRSDQAVIPLTFTAPAR